MHPFAKYIQILGKGRNGMRPLTREEAYEAMQMIACYDVEPAQLGAFLMLMRVKEETAQKVAGFTEALRESLPLYDMSFKPAIDWAAYAGKKRQLPWFLLAALMLGQSRTLICKGEGGEFERIPDRAVELYGVTDGEGWRETWEMLIRPGSEVKPERLDLNHFHAVWEGQAEDRYAEFAVSGTLALLIRALGIETTPQAAQQLGLEWWRQRHQSELVQEAI